MSFDNYLSKANATLRAEIAAKDRALADLRALADSVVFHQLDCLGGCHESVASLARLAKAINYRSNPATEEEIEEALVAPRDTAKTYECYIEERQGVIAAKDGELALFQAVENHLPSTWAIGDDATAELALGLANRDKEIARLREALTIGRDLVGPWLSGALDDPETCEAMKGDISLFFDAIEGCTSASEGEKKEGPGAVDILINTPTGARPGAGDIPEAPAEKL